MSPAVLRVLLALAPGLVYSTSSDGPEKWGHCGQYESWCADITPDMVWSWTLSDQFFRLAMAALLGALVGLNMEFGYIWRFFWRRLYRRLRKQKPTGEELEYNDRIPTGLQTHMLISVGACLFTFIGTFGFAPNVPYRVGPRIVGDMNRVAAGVVRGVGFLGAGAILNQQDGGKNQQSGLVDAAAMWCSGALGVVSAHLGRETTGTAFLALTLITTAVNLLALLEEFIHSRFKKVRFPTVQVHLVLFSAHEACEDTIRQLLALVETQTGPVTACAVDISTKDEHRHRIELVLVAKVVPGSRLTATVARLATFSPQVQSVSIKDWGSDVTQSLLRRARSSSMNSASSTNSLAGLDVGSDTSPRSPSLLSASGDLTMLEAKLDYDSGANLQI